MSHVSPGIPRPGRPLGQVLHPALQALLLSVSALAATGCAPAETEAQAKEGSGLVILPSDNPADLERPYFHDFGRVADGDRVRHVFVLENTDPRPVTIKRVVPGCGCTIPILRAIHPDGEVTLGRPATSKEDLLVVPPGARAEVELAVDTTKISQKNTDKLVTTRMTTDSVNGFYLSFEIHLVVERPFNVVPNGIDLGRIPVSGGGTGRLEIVAVPGFTRTVSRILEQPEHVVAELWSEDRLGRTVWTLEAGYDPPIDPGSHIDTITLETLDEDGLVSTPIRVGVTGLGVDDIEPLGRFAFAAARDETMSAVLDVHSLLAGHTFAVERVVIPPPHDAYLRVDFAAKSPDSRGKSGVWTLTLETLTPLPVDEELLRGDLDVLLDDPGHPRVAVPYAIHLR